MVGSHNQRLFQSYKKSYCWSKLQVSEAGYWKFFGLNARTRPRFGGRSAGQCTMTKSPGIRQLTGRLPLQTTQ